MIWDKIFWVWFILTGLFLIYSLIAESSSLNIYLALLLAGLGFLKLAEESKRKEKTVSKKLLERLKK